MAHLMKTKPGVTCHGRIVQDPVTMRRSCNLCRESIIDGPSEPKSNPHFEATPESLNKLLAQKAEQRRIQAEKDQLIREGKKEEADKLDPSSVRFDASGQAGLKEGIVASPAGVAALMKKPPQTTPFIGQTAEPVGESGDAFVTPQTAVAAQIAGMKVAEAQEAPPQAPLLGMLEKASQEGAKQAPQKKK